MYHGFTKILSNTTDWTIKSYLFKSALMISDGSCDTEVWGKIVKIAIIILNTF